MAHTMSQESAGGATDVGDTRSREAELQRMREFYEREGWLTGPHPERLTLVRRNRAM